MKTIRTERKPRSDSRLKNLPEERQSEIVEYARGHSLVETVKWLREEGVEICDATLSVYLSWYRLQQRLAKNESTVKSVLENLKRNDPKLTVEQVELAGQAFFSALAIEQEDSLTWKRIQDLKLRVSVLELSREKFEVQTCETFLKWFADKKARDIAERDIPNSAKIAALREAYFKEIDELEQSGEVEIPE